MATSQITLTPPADSNTAGAWNDALRAAAKEANITLPEPGAQPRHEDGTFASKTEAKQPEAPAEETVYQFPVTVNGKEVMIEDKDPAKLLEKVAIAQEAGTPAPAAAAEEEKKPALSEADLFDIQVKLGAGDVTALDLYLEKSGVLDRYLEKQGIPVAALKEQVEARQSGKLTDGWKQATSAFMDKIKAGEIDYPVNDKGEGSQQNMIIMGLMLAELGLRDKPSVESFEAAYALMKERNLVFPMGPAAATEPGPAPKKKLTSSTVVGSTGGQEVRRTAPVGQVEIDITQLTPHQMSAAWNQALADGYKPEQIIIKR